MIYKRRFVIAAASSALALAAQAQDTENEPLEQVVVTGTRVANRSALDTAVPVDVVSSRATAERRRCRGQPGARGRPALVQLPAARARRRHRHDPACDAARPCARSDTRARQRQAAPRGFARERQRHDRPRLFGGRPQHDSRRRWCNRSKCCATARRRSTARMRSPACSTCACAKRTKAAMQPSATAGATRVTTRRPPRRTAASPRRCLCRSGRRRRGPHQSNLSRDVSDGDTLVASIWKGLALGESGFVTVAAEYKDQEHTERGGYDMRRQYPLLPGNVFDPRESDVQSLQLLVRRAGAGSEDRVRQRRLRFRERRAHVRLGELAGPRREGAGLLSPRRRSVEPQRDRDLSRRLPAVHRAGGHRLLGRVRRALEARRLGHGLLARLRQEQDGVHDREHAEPLARRRRARRCSTPAASTTTSWC